MHFSTPSQITLLLLAVASIGISVAGMVLLDFELVSRMFGRMDAAVNFGTSISVTADQLLADVSAVNPTLDALIAFLDTNVDFRVTKAYLQVCKRLGVDESMK